MKDAERAHKEINNMTRDMLDRAQKRLGDEAAEKDPEKVEANLLRAREEAAERCEWSAVEGLNKDLAEYQAPKTRRERVSTFDVVFDGHPSHESCRFVETEIDDSGVVVGKWDEGRHGLWYLRFTGFDLLELARRVAKSGRVPARDRD